MSKRNSQLALVKGEERSLPSLASVRELVSELGEADQQLVLAETMEFYRSQQTGALSLLSMGEHAERIRQVLEPVGKWKAWAGSLPNMGIASVYRAIWAWQNAQQLPEATRRVAAREGFKLISSAKDGGFSPPYAKAVKVVERELGPAPATEPEARTWLQAVQTAKKRFSKVGRPRNAQKLSVAHYVKRVMSIVNSFLGRMSEDRQAAFAQQLMSELAGVMNVKKPSGSVAA